MYVLLALHRLLYVCAVSFAQCCYVLFSLVQCCYMYVLLALHRLLHAVSFAQCCYVLLALHSAVMCC